MKSIAKIVLGISLLMLPYVTMHSCEQNAYGLLKGKREYVECTGLRKIENRRKVLDAQEKLYEQVRNFFK